MEQAVKGRTKVLVVEVVLLPEVIRESVVGLPHGGVAHVRQVMPGDMQ